LIVAVKNEEGDKTMRNIKALQNLIICFLLLMTIQPVIAASTSTNASAGTSGASAAFSSGTATLGMVVGSGRFNNNDYLILGGSAGYYLVKGLEVGIDLEHWFSSKPAITKVSPQIRYVFTQVGTLKPYIGTFFRRTFFSGNTVSDRNSYGYRVGTYFSTGNNIYLGGGVVVEKYQKCGDINNCTNTYPEIIISFSF
jgi:hypothetical protein